MAAHLTRKQKEHIKEKFGIDCYDKDIIITRITRRHYLAPAGSLAFIDTKKNWFHIVHDSEVFSGPFTKDVRKIMGGKHGR